MPDRKVRLSQQRCKCLHSTFIFLYTQAVIAFSWSFPFWNGNVLNRNCSNIYIKLNKVAFPSNIWWLVSPQLSACKKQLKTKQLTPIIPKQTGLLTILIHMLLFFSNVLFLKKIYCFSNSQKVFKEKFQCGLRILKVLSKKISLVSSKEIYHLFTLRDKWRNE